MISTLERSIVELKWLPFCQVLSHALKESFSLPLQGSWVKEDKVDLHPHQVYLEPQHDDLSYHIRFLQKAICISGLVWGFQNIFSVYLWLFWNSLRRPGWPRTQRSTCLCLLRVGPKGVCHPHSAQEEVLNQNTSPFVLASLAEYSERYSLAYHTQVMLAHSLT